MALGGFQRLAQAVKDKAGSLGSGRHANFLGVAPRDAVVPRHVQIVAHPDDDLYFLNPDLMQAVQRGEEVMSICLTLGETDGKNLSSGHPDFETTEVDFAGYGAARQNGLRAAYAYMATGDRHSPWRQEPLEIGRLGCAELCTLEAAPHVRLIFLNFLSDGTHSNVPGAGNVRELWLGEAQLLASVVPTGSAMPRSGTIGREQLVALLAELLRRCRPTLVRTMDPDPAFQKHDDDNRQHADYEDYSDHQDHTATALFSWAAIQAYEAGSGQPAAAVESYRGYYNERWPHNLSATAFRTKADILAVYGWADGHECALPSGCGDRKVLGWAPSTGWGQSTTHRYANSTTWLHPGPDGTLNAFAVLGGQAHHWRQSPDGTWSTATVLPGDRLLPHLATVTDPEGRIHLFAVRMTLDAAPEKQRREILTAWQRTPGGAFGAWESLGNPHETPRTQVDRRRGVGMPTVATDGDGRIHVLVKNYGGGACGRIRALSGDWGGWIDLRGSETQDGFSAVRGPAGEVELYATSHSGVLRWFRSTAGGPERRVTLALPPLSGPPTALALPDGRIQLVGRDPDTGWVLGYRQLAPAAGEAVTPDTRWDEQPLLLTTGGGFGAVAAAVSPSGESLAVAQRDEAGGVGWSLLPLDGTEPGVTHHSDAALLVHSPAVAFDASGNLVLAALGTDARLRVAVADGKTGDLAEDWRTIH